MTSKLASRLEPLDIFPYGDSVVTVLQTPEHTLDTFGRDMLKVWCAAGDSEGWVILGPLADIPMLRLSGAVGHWSVTVEPGRVSAHKDGSEPYSTSCIRFPVGYRVGQAWSPEQPPKTVLALANRLAKQLVL